MIRTIVLVWLVVSGVWAAAPQWYASQTLQPSKSYEIYGYGEGKDLAEARMRAKEDIAGQLLTEIRSVKRSRMHADDARLKQSMDIEIDAQVHTVLSDVRTVRSEQKDGRYYVVLLYRNLSLARRLIEKSGHVECLRKPVNPYLAQTPLYEKIRRAAGCDIDVSLVRRAGAWFIAYKTAMVAVAPRDYEDLFVSTRHSPVRLSVSKRVLREGERFSLTLTSARRGYVALLDVYANGITAVVEPALKVEPGKPLRIPSADSPYLFEAAVLEKGHATYDLYVVLFSRNPIDVSRFDMASDRLLGAEDAYRADELLRLTKRYPFTTRFVRTLPR